MEKGPQLHFRKLNNINSNANLHQRYSFVALNLCYLLRLLNNISVKFRAKELHPSRHALFQGFHGGS